MICIKVQCQPLVFNVGKGMNGNEMYLHNNAITKPEISKFQSVGKYGTIYEGGSRSPCNHLFFSSHGCIYTKVAVSTSTMNLCLSCHVTWTILHAWLHYGISKKTMHFGHYLLSQIGRKFELRENPVVAF